ncbi:MAG: iron transporter [Nocardioidaceae bacterium]
MRSSALVLALAVPCTLLLGGCADNGASVTSSSTGSSGSASTGSSASASAASASMAEAARSGERAGAVPAGVAAQYSVLEEEIAAEGGETTAGEWRIAYIVEPAEPWYESHHGHQKFREAADGETHHIEIIPIEKSTGRVVPDVPIRVEVVNQAGDVVDARPLSFYYSEFFHYANNFVVPQPGSYTLRAEIDAPTFRRHGEAGQDPALDEGTTVSFDGVRLEPAH